MPRGGGEDRDEPAFVQAKINRALGDAPLAAAGAVPLRCRTRPTGYRLTAFLPAAVLATEPVAIGPSQSLKNS